MSADYITEPGERGGPTLEDLYELLASSIDVVADLAVTAQKLGLDAGLCKVPEAALARLVQFKAQVNPDDPDGPF